MFPRVQPALEPEAGAAGVGWRPMGEISRGQWGGVDGGGVALMSVGPSPRAHSTDAVALKVAKSAQTFLHFRISSI